MSKRIPLVAAVALLVGVAGAGGTVRISSAEGTRTHQTCLVPNVKGKKVRAAEQAIKRHHCSLGGFRLTFSAAVAKGLVISQRPKPGTRRPAGSRVGLVASKGAPLPSAGTVVQQISVPDEPLGLLALPGAVWVAPHGSDSIDRIDTASNTVVAHLVVVPAQSGEEPGRMVFGGGTLFAENYVGNAISLIDPSNNTLVSTIHAPLEDCCSPAYGAGSLWLLEYSSSGAPNPDRLVRLDPSGQVLMTMTLNDAKGLVFGAGSVWGFSGGRVFRLDPATNEIVAQISADAVPAAFGAGSVWGLSETGSELVRIDPATNRATATIRLPADGSVVTATDNAVWVAEGPGDSPGSHLWKIDPATNQVVGQVNLGLASALDDVVVGDDGDVWVSAYDSNQVLRIHPTG